MKIGGLEKEIPNWVLVFLALVMLGVLIWQVMNRMLGGLG